MQNRQELIEFYGTEDQVEVSKPRSDINLKKVKEILARCHAETDKKLEELAKKCVKKNEQQKA